MSQQSEKAKKTVYFSILGSFGLAVIKWLAGFFGNSFALIADAIESTSDIFSSILVPATCLYLTCRLLGREMLYRLPCNRLLVIGLISC